MKTTYISKASPFHHLCHWNGGSTNPTIAARNLQPPYGSSPRRGESHQTIDKSKGPRDQEKYRENHISEASPEKNLLRHWSISTQPPPLSTHNPYPSARNLPLIFLVVFLCHKTHVQFLTRKRPFSDTGLYQHNHHLFQHKTYILLLKISRLSSSQFFCVLKRTFNFDPPSRHTPTPQAPSAQRSLRRTTCGDKPTGYREFHVGSRGRAARLVCRRKRGASG